MRPRLAHIRTTSPLQAGFSVVELMIALAAGVVVCTAVIAFLLSSMKSNGDYVQSTRLTQELRNTLDLVVRDISRAGYSDNSLVLASLPIASAFTPMLVKDSTPLVVSGSVATYGNADVDGCVIYSYDRTFPIGYRDNVACDTIAGCGTAGEIDAANGEIRGVRLSCIDGSCDGEADDVGVVEVAESTDGVVPACDGDPADYSTNPSTCNADSGWCGLSDSTLLNVHRLMFIDVSSNQSNAMRIRDLGIHIEGQLRSGSDFTRGVSSNVKVRADCINRTLASCMSAPAP